MPKLDLFRSKLGAHQARIRRSQRTVGQRFFITSLDYYAASAVQCLLTVFLQVMPEHSSRHKCHSPAWGQDTGEEWSQFLVTFSPSQPTEYNLQMEITLPLFSLHSALGCQWESSLGGALNHHEAGEGTADAWEHHMGYEDIPCQKPRDKTQNSCLKMLRMTHKQTKSYFSSQLDQKQEKLFGTIKEKASKALSYDSNHRQEAFQPSRD